jgi:hypothetical protein
MSLFREAQANRVKWENPTVSIDQEVRKSD